MAVIPAVVTDLARARWPQMFGGLLPFKTIVKFRIGEGGWIFNLLTLQREPRAPDPTLTTLDIITDQIRFPLNKRYNVGETFGYFEKLMVLTDFSFEAPTTLKSSCLLTFTEYNFENDGTLIYDMGGPYVSPEMWEIGLFDQDDVMIAYGTFPKQTKTGANQDENIVRVTF
jgi:hypothetical protein